MILLIDNYDSFTFNIYQYIGQFSEEVMIVRNNTLTIEEIKRLEPDKIVISPGPKRPKDAGICMDAIKYFSGKVPILGICLGHQCIAEAFGGDIIHAKALFHGKQSNIIQKKENVLLEDMGENFLAARYHSLVVDAETLPEILEITAESKDGEIMAIKHKKHETYGIQFHPESIYTPEGMKIIKSFMTKMN